MKRRKRCIGMRLNMCHPILGLDIPEFELFNRASKRQNVLLGEELDDLFPDDEKELIDVWKRPDEMRKERDEIALMFGTLFCVAVSAGMRSGEIRALFSEQVNLPNSGLMIDRAVDDMGLHVKRTKIRLSNFKGCLCLFDALTTSYNGRILLNSCC